MKSTRTDRTRGATHKGVMHLALLSFLVFSCVFTTARGQTPVELVTDAPETRVTVLENSRLHVEVTSENAHTWQVKGHVRYSDLGAVGDGETDDIDAVVATHAVANRLNLPVHADEDAAYYISGKDRTAAVQTDTDFGSASFIIDDTAVQNRHAHVFLVTSRLEAFEPEGVTSLKRNQERIDAALPGPSLIRVTDANVRRYIRKGANQNQGAPQTDIFIVDQDGYVDMHAPIIWDFDQITDITAWPIDPGTLTLIGGRFTTMANRDESKYNYYRRGIGIRRSNVEVDGMEHRVTGEGDHGAPYGGFIDIGDCAQVTVKNTLLTGRKTYITVGSAGVDVPMGSYDINVHRAINVSFVNVRQTNDINDQTHWGIMGSNYSKNLLYDRCVLSRFDAHMGVVNATIRHSTLGHQGINAIGTGTFLVEHSTIHGRSLISLRSDYGSTWQGDLVIRDCVFVPFAGHPVGEVSLIAGSNSGRHDFGYTCYMPERVVIENLRIDDARHHAGYRGPAVFANFNPQMTGGTYQETFPHVRPREVTLRNVATASGKPLRLSDNPFLFKDVNVSGLDD